MIGILIFWLIAGILVLAVSSMSYFYNILGDVAFGGIFLLGIIILLLSAHYLWDSKRKPSGKPDHDSLKNMFTIILIISVIMLVLGGLGYLINLFEVYVFDTQTYMTMKAFMITGLVITIGCILSFIYVERRMPAALSSSIMKQQHNLDRMKSNSEEIGSDIKSRGKDVKDSIEAASKVSEKNKLEMTKR